MKLYAVILTDDGNKAVTPLKYVKDIVVAHWEKRQRLSIFHEGKKVAGVYVGRDGKYHSFDKLEV